MTGEHVTFEFIQVQIYYRFSQILGSLYKNSELELTPLFSFRMKTKSFSTFWSNVYYYLTISNSARCSKAWNLFIKNWTWSKNSLAIYFHALYPDRSTCCEIVSKVPKFSFASTKNENSNHFERVTWKSRSRNSNENKCIIWKPFQTLSNKLYLVKLSHSSNNFVCIKIKFFYTLNKFHLNVTLFYNVKSWQVHIWR